MKILLTGARGFTGNWFSRLAESRGHMVIPLEADIRIRSSIDAAMQGLDFTHVVHLAAISFAAHTDLEAIYQVNILGTLKLLEALKDRGVSIERILLASSANVYGNASVSPVAETVCPAPVNHYANSKLSMEFMAKTFIDPLPIFFTRPFNYTGPGQCLDFLMPKLIYHFTSRAPLVELGNLDVEREFNDVRMVCEAYIQLLESASVGETYNICTGVGYSLQNILNILKGLTGHEIAVRINPHFVRPNEVHRLVGDPSKLHAALGDLTPYPLENMLSLMLSK